MTVHVVRRDLTYLVEAWPVLVEMKIPGTARAWVERPRRMGSLTAADIERMGPQGVPRPAPADVSVLDLLWQIAQTADLVLRTVHIVIDLDSRRHLPASSAFLDPRPWLQDAGLWVEQAQQDDELTVPWMRGLLDPLAASTARLLGDVRDGQVINAVCPWCDGKVGVGQMGGRTMELRHPDDREELEDPMIVCRGIDCRPPASACGQRWQELPAWPRREWDWLASQLKTAVLV